MNNTNRPPDKKPSFVLKEFLAQKDKSTNDAVVSLRPNMYALAKTDDAEAKLKKDTIGLVQYDDFKRLKKEIEHNKERQASPASDSSDSEARRKKLAKLEKKRKSKLSFAFDGNDEEDTEGGVDTSANESSAKPSRSASVMEGDEDNTTMVIGRKRLKLGKDPSVNTSFLPDREREEQERIEKERRHEEWSKKQEEIKAETVEIQFAYFDGLSHLGSVKVKKGEPVFNLIDKAKQQFSAIRDVGAEKLLFAKDDVIIPHEMSLYYFQAHEVKGKFGLLFEFYDPENLGRIRNKNDVRLGRIVTRKYAENNKHIYPCSKWELYDPEKDVSPLHVDVG